jgi:hypothetical protein
MESWRESQPAIDRGTPLAQASKRMATTTTRLLARPAKDEWGVYDPQQAGIAALVARLDARDTKTAAAVTAPATKKETTEPATPARPTLGDAQ